MINGEFMIHTPEAHAQQGPLVKSLQAAEAGLLSARDFIQTLQERVAELTAENEKKTATIRKLERRVKQLESRLDADKPISLPWASFMGDRHDTGLLEVE